MYITVLELLRMDLNSIHLIDIIHKKRYEEGHIPGAVSIVSSELIYHAPFYLKRGEVYYLYCDYGEISADVCRKLAMQGYRAISIVGGYKNYLLRR